ncbi:cation:proton antiporter [Cellulomonas cellasea]|uniref:Cation transporter n=2 Tax=Cellulomonas cellasea TaxID=43670 RepID=A0A0A0B8N6_9CELL|nr:cation:proton antiporter [Cellulomonas cellasea]KGM02179.1 cation transporter [Cellulomonas cellasea DSM 20118]GEA88946.1 cation transporter [Cellulomonas cellasea]
MIEFEGPGGLFAAIGLATLAAALLPRILGRAPVSMPMVFLAAGFVGFTVLPGLPDPDPLEHGSITEHLTEVCVIVSLMGAGLALNRPLGWRTWSTTWRLLAIAMPLSMLAVGVLGWAVLGLGAASAVLIAAALAPTDPVLATEVQVSEPVTDGEAADDEARFALTSEAGLNDGLAFPFTYLAIALSAAAAAQEGPGEWVPEWLLVDVAWRIGLGVLAGVAVGWALGRIFFSTVADKLGLTEKAEGFVALAATFLAYGAAELAEGYGFVAVFVCACTLRTAERQHGYHAVLHKFVEQIERLLTVAVVVLLGGAVARGLLDELGWAEVGVAAAFLLVIRPLAGWIALTPGKTGPGERAVIAFFGVRGVGTLYYVAYALEHATFPGEGELWGIAGLVVVGSIVLHGIGATPVMAALDRRRARAADEKDEVTIAGTPV